MNDAILAGRDGFRWLTVVEAENYRGPVGWYHDRIEVTAEDLARLDPQPAGNPDYVTADPEHPGWVNVINTQGTRFRIGEGGAIHPLELRPVVAGLDNLRPFQSHDEQVHFGRWLSRAVTDVASGIRLNLRNDGVRATGPIQFTVFDAPVDPGNPLGELILARGLVVVGTRVYQRTVRAFRSDMRFPVKDIDRAWDFVYSTGRTLFKKESAMHETMISARRFATVYINQDDLVAHPEEYMRAFFSRVVVTSAISKFQTREFEYECASPMFEPLPLGVASPSMRMVRVNGVLVLSPDNRG